MKLGLWITSKQTQKEGSIGCVSSMAHDFSILAPICPADSVAHPRSMDFFISSKSLEIDGLTYLRLIASHGYFSASELDRGLGWLVALF